MARDSIVIFYGNQTGLGSDMDKASDASRILSRSGGTCEAEVWRLVSGWVFTLRSYVEMNISKHRAQSVFECLGGRIRHIWYRRIFLGDVCLSSEGVLTIGK